MSFLLEQKKLLLYMRQFQPETVMPDDPKVGFFGRSLRKKIRCITERRTFVSPLATDLPGNHVIKKLKTGEYRLYSRKVNPQTGQRRNLGTFRTREAAEKHERAVQFFKRAH